VSALVLKDLRLLRPYRWLIVPGYLLFSANGIEHPEAFFWVNVALASVYSLTLIMIEWKQDADRYLASLPVGREEMVQARYAGALGAAVLGTAVYTFYGRVLIGFGGERLERRWPGTPGWETPEGVLAFFLVTILLAVAYLPFYFRWGFGKGSWLFVASLPPVAAALAPLVHGTGAEGRLPSEHLRSALAALSGAAHPVATVAAALLGAAVLGWLSLRLSIAFYARRDL
jgi:hypothetical protein